MMKKCLFHTKKYLGFLCFVFLFFDLSYALDRFPAPEFETAYQIPETQHPGTRAHLLEYMDIVVLCACLFMSAFFALKKRSRHGIYLLTLFSVFYFGFYRKGCVCSVGSIQNLTMSFFQADCFLPLTVLLFFSIPLFFALFYGRVFCAGVCPLGALQELFIFKPFKLPATLILLLGMLPFIYLGLAVLFSATGAGFIICQYDPFVGFFRLSGPYPIMVFGISLLILGIFIARPYCRFLCPYGVLLGIFSFFSKNHISITPRTCIQCKLCENSCPNDAILYPAPKAFNLNKHKEIRKMFFLMLLVPVFIFISGFCTSYLAGFLSKKHRIIRLAEQILTEQQGLTDFTTLDSDAFREQGMTKKTLFDEALRIKQKFNTGTWLLGFFLGIVFSWKIIILMLRKNRVDYEPDRFHCLSCGRCMEFCPVEKEILKT